MGSSRQPASTPFYCLLPIAYCLPPTAHGVRPAGSDTISRGHFMHSIGTLTALGLVAALCLTGQSAAAQTTYQKPPKAILDVLDAPANPVVISVSPAKDRLLLATSDRHLSIADLAEPVLRLAGLRISPKTNGPERAYPRQTGLLLKSIADGSETRIELPPDADPALFRWSPDGKRFALTNATAGGIELWVGDSATGGVRKLAGVTVNAAYGNALQWLPDGKTLLVQTVVADRGPAPIAPAVPAGPTVQENFGKTTPARTYQDLLKSPHDEDLFDYYATSQLVLVSAVDGKATPLGKPAVVRSIQPSPGGSYVLG